MGLSVACLYVVFLLMPVIAQGAEKLPWKSFPTKRTTIRYLSDKDLKKFDKSIDYAPGAGFSSMFSKANEKEQRAKLKKKIDALFERVRAILDMKKYVRKVRIDLYPGKKQLHAAYQELFKRENTHRAWYSFKLHTIYIQVNDINEGILAHEMAHAIIDHFFKTRPPSATAEILARFVDAHLFK